MDKKLTALIIMDGFGINEAKDGNAIIAAGTPELDKLMKKYVPAYTIRRSSLHAS